LLNHGSQDPPEEKRSDHGHDQDCGHADEHHPEIGEVIKKRFGVILRIPEGENRFQIHDALLRKRLG
jgi:hypothetical protein